MEGTNQKTYSENLSLLRKLFAQNNERQLSQDLVQMNIHHIVDCMVDLPQHRRRLFGLLPAYLQAEAIVLLPEKISIELLGRLPAGTISDFLTYTDDDDTVRILRSLSDTTKISVQRKFQKHRAKTFSHLLTFDSESAGGAMDLNFVLVPASFTYGDVIEKLRDHSGKERAVPPVIVVVDDRATYLGIVPFEMLVGLQPETIIHTLVKDVPTVLASSDREDLTHALKRSHYDVVVVVEKNKQPVGIVHSHYILQVAEQEATEDFYKFAGVKKDEGVFDSAFTAVRYRYKWLIINLFTAFLAAFVVAQFQDIITSFVLLAAYMPIVAGMGGNAATQTLAVVVRGLALRHIRLRHAWRIMGKEMLAGLVNGLIVGGVATFFITLFNGDPVIGALLGISVLLNLLIAGTFGALVPIALKALRLDPASSSSVFITTATDVFGFLIFLGLATAVL